MTSSHSFKLTKKILKYFGLGLLTIIFFFIILLGFYLYKAQSDPYGKSIISGLREDVFITFDESGIAHVEAKSFNDALFSLGYLHARERGWQLEFNRRLASGTLSEIFGEKTLPVDRFIRTLGIRVAARKQYEFLTSETKLSLEAYTRGINAGFKDLGWALPTEFILTGTKPGLWTPIDSLSWMMMMALDLGDNWGKEVQRLQLGSILSTEEIWQVIPPYNREAPASSVDFASLYRQIDLYQKTPANDLKVSSIPSEIDAIFNFGHEGKGSNNWVISGKRTRSGKPILANDPHLGLTSPSTWYFVHLKAKDMNVVGGSIPGLPGVILGHTDKVAWGFTNTAADVQDLFIEKIEQDNPAKYKTQNGTETFNIRRETIAVKGAASSTILVRQTIHGPVISDVYSPLQTLVNTDKYAISLKWSALDKNNQSIKSLLELNKANSIEQLRDAFNKFYAPMQNVVMADTNGEIAFMAAGVAPKRIKGLGMAGVAPVLGWIEKNEWGPYLTSTEMPSDFSSVAPWIATANQQIEIENSPYFLTADWTPPFRFERIEELISENVRHDVNSSMQMQADTLSKGAQPLLPLFQSTTVDHPLFSTSKPLIDNFQGDMKMDSAAALIFNAWVDELTQLVFKPKLGHFFNDIYRQRNLREGLIGLLQNKNSLWCDQLQTPQIESCSSLSSEALNRALTRLSKRYGNDPNKWQWGQAHIAIAKHQPFSEVPILNHFYELRVPVAGDTFTINVSKMGMSNPSEPYYANLAPGMRAIYDLNDLNQSVFMGIGGQSGWVQNKRYRDYLTPWQQSAYLPLTLQPKGEHLNLLTLKAR